MYKKLISNSFLLMCMLPLLCGSLVCSAAAKDILHFQSQTDWSAEPSPQLAMNKRINQDALRLAETGRYEGPVKRVAYFDIAYPSNSQEFSALDGNAVILVTSLSHEENELPLKQVYVKSGGTNIELKRISFMLFKQSPNSPAGKAFGQYRMDGMYLFPVYLKAKPGKIYIDFARNREGFGLSEFDGTDIGRLAGMPLTPPVGKGPSLEALRKFITREFPGFKLPYARP